MNKMKLRHELKHYINLSDYFALRQRLRAIAKSDSHAGTDGKYQVRSLYFDNIDDKVLLEKINGVNMREKFRIRYYNEDYSYILLEKKSKINGLCAKQSTRLTKEQCEQLLEEDIEWMKHSKIDLICELYAKMKFQQLKPKTLVDYTREPYIYPPGNVRITIDSDIRTGLYSKDLFDKELPTLTAGAAGVVILEVKYDEFIPEIISDIIQLGNRQHTAFSKYAACRIYG